jgi:hypothetical protein
MAEILLANGEITIVDDDRYEYLSQRIWRCKRDGYTSYAYRNETHFDVNGNKRKTIHMHRIIMDAPPGRDVDHINHNGLDNRRCNLRIVSRAENSSNTRPGLPLFGRRRGTP